tara:strand:+ start:293 stop:775 length:483 start_codon:yes stop_codon:yes gene_type:complete
MASSKMIRLVNSTKNLVVTRESLPLGIKMVLVSARSWVSAARQGRCTKKVLIPLFTRMECAYLIPVFDQLMVTLSSAAFRPIAVKSPHSKELSADEVTLARALEALAGDNVSRCRVLLSDMIDPSLSRPVITVVAELIKGLKQAQFPCKSSTKLRLVERS